MGETSGQVGQGLGVEGSTNQLRQEIKETPQELGDTVASLAERADLKGQVKDKATQARATFQERLAEASHATSAKLQQLSGQAREKTPGSAAEGAQQGIAVARDNPLPVAAAGIFVAGVGLGRLMGRRKYRKRARAKGAV